MLWKMPPKKTSQDLLGKGTSLEPEWRKLILALEYASEDQFMLWIARVPSASNVADHTSRGTLKELEWMKPFGFVTPACPLTHGLVKSNLDAEADGGK